MIHLIVYGPHYCIEKLLDSTKDAMKYIGDLKLQGFEVKSYEINVLKGE